jgi:hypothetical protein
MGFIHKELITMHGHTILKINSYLKQNTVLVHQKYQPINVV